MRIRLIDDWRNAWKLYSVQVFALIGAFPTFYNELVSLGYLEGAPPELLMVMRILAIVGLAARLLKQESKGQ